MSNTEMEKLIAQQGWTIRRRPRRKGRIYIYAAKRQGLKIREVYIAPESKIDQLTPAQILEKLHM